MAYRTALNTALILVSTTLAASCSSKKPQATLPSEIKLPDNPAAPGSLAEVKSVQAALMFEGNVTVAKELTCTGKVDAVSTAAVKLSYRWLTADAATGEFVPIDGAVGERFVVRSSEAHKYIRCEVTALGIKGLSAITNSNIVPIYDSLPTANNANVIVQEDENIALTFSINKEYTDADNDFATSIEVRNVTSGSMDLAWTCSTDGTCSNVFTPQKGFNGEASFEYRVANAFTLASNWASATISVLPVNYAPTLAAIEDISSYRGSTISFDLVASDKDAEDVLTYSCVQNCPAGLEVNDNHVSWSIPQIQPSQLFPVFQVQDAAGLLDTKVAKITVDNHIPENMLATINQSSGKVGNAVTCVASATDIDGDTLSYSYIWQISPTGIDGSFINDTAPGWNTASISIAASHAHSFLRCAAFADDNGGVVVQAVSPVFTVSDTSPQAQAVSFTTNEDSSLNVSIGSAAGYFDADGDPIANITVQNLVNGSFDSNSTWSCVASACSRVFIPSTNFSGTASFEFVTENAYAAQQSPSLATITVNTVNDAPVITAVSDIQQAITGSLFTMNLEATDVDTGDTLTFSCAPSCVAGLSVVGNVVEWTPNDSQAGLQNLSFRVTDLAGDYSETSVKFNVVDNTPPNVPILSTTEPPSPAASRSFVIKGVASTDSTVRLYSNDTCTGSPIKSATGASYNASGFSISFEITEVSKVYSANAVDASNNVSGCSLPITYQRFPERLGSFNSLEAPSTPTKFVSAGSVAYFVADDGFTGIELWKTDGTAGGTSLVADINRDGNSSPANMTVLNGVLYFTAFTPSTGIELWMSDGTEAGTHVVEDLNPGIASSSPTNLTVLGNTIVFTATTAATGTELFISDGTEAGTGILKELRPGTSSASFAAPFVSMNNKIYFRASDSVSGSELWVTDGTAFGTMIVKDIYAGSGSSNPSFLVSSGNTLFFAATETAGGTELWMSDGTAAGTLLVKDIYPGTTASSPTALAAVNGVVYFAANDGVNGVELWRSDGTDAGTFLLKDINAGTANSTPNQLVAWNSQIFFAATETTNGLEIWKSDGTAAGTTIIKNIYSGVTSSSPTNFSVTPWGVFFAAASGKNRELWFTDGTAVKTVKAGALVSGSTSPTAVVALTDKVVFGAKNSGDNELYKATTLAGSSALVKNIRAKGTTQDALYATELNGVLFFPGNSTAEGVELWKSDGTAAGTVMVKSIYAGATSSSPAYLTTCNGAVYFVATSSANGRELWKSDGTAAGTFLLKDIRSGTTSSSPTNLTCHANTLFFQATEGVNGIELWRSDGTGAGTFMLKDINTGSANSSPANFRVAGGVLFFSATSSASGNELWKTDGTGIGTVLVKDIYGGTASSSPSLLVNVAEKLMFVATTSANGQELWTSDGTSAGTALVKDIRAGTSASGIVNPVAISSVLYFSANNSTNGQELWKSDGTAAGTLLVSDLITGTGSSSPTSLTNVGGTLYFAASTTAAGIELRKYDGVSVSLVKDLAPGTLSSSPVWIANAGGKAVFYASDSISGHDIWTSDGTAAGTYRIFDNNKEVGTAANNNPLFTVIGDALHLFSWAYGETGLSLWKM